MLSAVDYSNPTTTKFEHRVTKTQIVCTIGPPTNSKEQIMKLIQAGLSVVRLNFSHGNHEVSTRYIRKLFQFDVEQIKLNFWLNAVPWIYHCQC